MLSKILAVALTAVVLTVGGYAYWQYADGEHQCCSTTTAPITTTNTAPPCCQESSRNICEVSCCSETGPSSSTEVLTIAPREVE